tara:strand:- start:207 stop:938 length:732 start_codon:yes stop_codon:yes gene_type:complete
MNNIKLEIKDKSEEIHLFIATPCYNSQVTSKYTECLIKTCNFLNEKDIKYTVKIINNDIVTTARNMLAHNFMNSELNFTHMLFIDADIIWKPQDIMNLLEHDLECVIGVYPNKQYYLRKDESGININILSSSQLYQPIQIKEDNENLIKVEFAATGFMMLKKTAFKRIEGDIKTFTLPQNKDNINTENYEHVYNYFHCNIVNSEYLTEDYHFSLLLNKNGGEIYADKRVGLLHTGNHHYGSLK